MSWRHDSACAPSCCAQDVEGYEPSVLSTASGLLSAGSIDNIVLEYTPGVIERLAR